MSKFIDELKRRNVVRVALAYIVVGWLFLQVSDILLDFIAAPEWVGQAIIGLLALGLIPAVVLAWVFEVTPEGVRRDTGEDGPASADRGRRLNTVTMIAVVAIGAVLVWQQLNPPIAAGLHPASISAVESLNETVVDDASVAVLPFADLSPQGDQGYFSDGISEEILNVLVRVDGLSVASRTSAFAFKGKSELGIPVIAEELAVRHVLEGSVRKAGTTIRITAQLIDAQSDKHLWSQTYDREMSVENIFAIQDEIAQSIVDELSSSLNLGNAMIVERVTADTDNIDAYDAFLRAQRQFLIRNTANLPDTVAQFERVVELDPEFARGWAGLAAAASVAPSWGHTNSGYENKARVAAETAIELDSRLALPYAVLGSLIVDGNPPVDFLGAENFYNQALERDPLQATVWLWRGIRTMNLGFFDRATSDLQRCLEIDPAYENCRRFVALTKLYAGDVEEALRLFEKGMEVAASSQVIPFSRAYAIKGDFRSAMFLVNVANASSVDGYDYTSFEYRALTESIIDFELERRSFEIEFKNSTGQLYDWSRGSAYFAHAMRNYSAIRPDLYEMVWWDRSQPEFLQSPERKRLIRQMGIYDYWLANGFPPQCRPLGDDDFECD